MSLLSSNEFVIEDNLFNMDEARKILASPVLSYDFIAAFLGKKLGSGCYRSVYDYNLGRDKDYVIKIEPGFSNCNHNEAQTWSEVSYFTGKLEWVKKWFAPVKWISPNGKVLCMEKTIPEHKKLKRPDMVPAFLNDFKYDNFGWIGNDFVCHDYGQLWNMTNYTSKKIKVNW